MTTDRAKKKEDAATGGVAGVSEGHAYLMTLSSYVEAVKQVEILFALALGVVVFGERQKVREIAPGAVVMLAGVVLLSLAA